MDGFLLIDKAGGVTSHDVVAMARKKLDTMGKKLMKQQYLLVNQLTLMIKMVM